MNIRMRLESLAEPDFRAFMAKLTPNVPKENMLGVRIPKLRKLAKQIGELIWKRQKMTALKRLCCRDW